MSDDGLRPGDEVGPDAEPQAGEVICSACGGSGEADGAACERCAGTGRVEQAVGGG